MYRVICDNKPLLEFSDERYRLYDTKLNLETDKAGSFQFTIHPEHPNYGIIERMKSNIRVYYGEKLIFSGRALDDESGFYNQDVFLCEGDMAMLNDSIQRPFRFPVDDSHTTPGDYFTFLVERHNAQMPPGKQFTVGRITVSDANGYIARSDTEYSSTWELIKSGLLNTVGGHIVLRIENDVKYLDYLEDFDNLSTQPIVFGENLLDILTKRKGADIATAILPLGKQDEKTDIRLTIDDLEDTETDDICKQGDIVYSKVAEAQYGGRIIKVVNWDDVTIDANLLRKARQELFIRRQVVSTQSLKAADMAAAGYDVEPWMLNRYVFVTDTPHQNVHELQPYYLIRALSVDLMNAANNTLTVGSVTSSFTARTQENLRKVMGELTIADQRTGVAISEMGESVSRLDSQITLTNEAVTNAYQFAQAINGRVVDIEAYIKTGHILDDADGMPVFGVLIGQQNLQAAFRSAFTATMLGFYEGEELIAFFSNKKQNVQTIRTANLELTDDLSDPEAVDWLISLQNGFTLRWIGA